MLEIELSKEDFKELIWEVKKFDKLEIELSNDFLTLFISSTK